MSLGKRLLLIVLPVFLILMGIYLANEILRMKKDYQQDFYASIRNQINILAPTLANALYNFEQVGAKDSLSGLFANNDMISAIMFDVNGKIFTGIKLNDTFKNGKKEKLLDIQDILNIETVLGAHFNTNQNQELIEQNINFGKRRFILPLWAQVAFSSQPKMFGTLIVEVSTERLSERISYVVLRLIIGTGLSLFISIMITYIFLKFQFIKPIRRIIAANLDVADGKYSKILIEEKESKDEIYLLAKNFNYMVDKLISGRNQLTKTLVDLQLASERAKESDKVKSTFLANMSHELRTPLNAIIGYSEMLKEDAIEEGNDEYVRDLNRIYGAGKHLLALVNDILDLSKIEAGKMDVYIENCNLTTLVDEVKNIILPLVKNKNNEIIINLEPGISYYYTDLVKLKQCILNLISNAVKFTSDGLITFSVRRITKDGQKWLQFIVSDTGIGIAPEYLSNLFQAFNQADASTTRKFGGTGLGLFITQNFCKLLGGYISVDSQLDIGTTFTITLPDEDYSSENIRDIANEDEKIVKAQIIKILIIDDDKKIHSLMEKILEKEGYEVIHAYDGEDGIKLAQKILPQVILLDVLMPKVDGWAVLGVVKSDPELRNIPVIIVTSHPDKNLALALGATEFLSKPFEPNQLLDLLNQQFLNIPISVMVVEDDDATRNLIVRTLSKTPWSITEAVNGAEALEQIKKHIPSIILLDLMLPEIDGFDLIEALQNNKDWENIPVIVITAKILTVNDRERLKVGVEMVLSKGDFKRRELLEIVKQEIKKYSIMSDFSKGNEP